MLFTLVSYAHVLDHGIPQTGFCARIWLADTSKVALVETKTL